MDQGDSDNASKTPRKSSKVSESSSPGQFRSLLSQEGKSVENGIQWPWASVIFVNALVGAGILNFPYSIHAAGGLPTAIIIQILMVLVLYCAVNAMAWCSHLRGTNVYQDTVKAYLGGGGQKLCSMMILVFCFLMGTTYMIAIAEQVEAATEILFNYAHGQNPWFLSKTTLMVYMSLIILPFCLVMHIDSLHYVSGAASFSVLFVAVVVIYEFFELDHPKVTVKTVPDHVSDILMAIPAYSVAYMFDVCSIAVYGRFKRRRVLDFAKASAMALCTVFIFYNIFAGFAYYTFGQHIQSNFMSNYRRKTPLIASAQLAYTVKLCLEYPIYQFLGWTALCSLFVTKKTTPPQTDSEVIKSKEASVDKPIDQCESEQQCKLKKLRAVSSASWILCTVAIGLAVPNINSILPLASAVVLNFQMTFPGLCLYAAVQLCSDEELSGWHRTLAKTMSICLTCLGISLSLLTAGNFLYSNRY